MGLDSPQARALASHAIGWVTPIRPRQAEVVKIQPPNVSCHSKYV